MRERRDATAVARRATAALLVALLLSSASAASAQSRGRQRVRPATDIPPPPSTTRDSADPAASAREHFMRGATLFDEGNLEGALAEFEESYRLRPVPVVLYNIAQTLKALFRYDEAIETYRRYLTLGSGQIDPERRDAVAVTIRELRDAIAELTFDVAPRGAEVRVDGRRIGAAPLESVVRVAAGRRVLEVTLRDHVPFRAEIVVVGRRARTLRVRLAPEDVAGRVRVSATEPNATVFFDGVEAGRVPATRRLSPGGHVVEVRASAFETWRSSVTLARRQVLSLHARLERESGTPLTGRWWFWAGVSAVLTGAAVGLYFALRPTDPEPILGNSDPGVLVVALPRVE